MDRMTQTSDVAFRRQRNATPDMWDKCTICHKRYGEKAIFDPGAIDPSDPKLGRTLGGFKGNCADGTIRALWGQ